MKKYVKPELFYESFELNTQIAACAFDAYNNTDAGVCAFKGDSVGDDADYIFTSSVQPLCNWEPSDLGSGSDCYYAPGADTSVGIGLFNS